MTLDGKKHSFYLSETTYACTMNTIVLPYLENHKSVGVFSHENRKLSYTSFLLDSFTANVVLLHGFAETKEKYNEVIYYFLKKKQGTNLLFYTDTLWVDVLLHCLLKKNLI